MPEGVISADDRLLSDAGNTALPTSFGKLGTSTQGKASEAHPRFRPSLVGGESFPR